MIDWLDSNSEPKFPNTAQALRDPNGLLAAGGRLSPRWLATAYRQGIFPWFDPSEVCLWWSPAPRAIITPNAFKLSRTNRKLLRRNTLKVTHNLAFENVIYACSEPRTETTDTWISEEMISAYCRLFHIGMAHSYELWSDSGDLVGGFYGLQVGGVFFGESMFSRINNASKIVFGYVAPLLFSSGVTLIDCQMMTSHLEQFGAHEITRENFESLLAAGLKGKTMPLASVL